MIPNEEDEEEEGHSDGGAVTFLADGDDVVRLQEGLSRPAVNHSKKSHEL
jgi:hypothetical protein